MRHFRSQCNCLLIGVSSLKQRGSLNVRKDVSERRPFPHVCSHGAVHARAVLPVISDSSFIQISGVSASNGGCHVTAESMGESDRDT